MNFLRGQFFGHKSFNLVNSQASIARNGIRMKVGCELSLRETQNCQAFRATKYQIIWMHLQLVLQIRILFTRKTFWEAQKLSNRDERLIERKQAIDVGLKLSFAWSSRKTLQTIKTSGVSEIFLRLQTI